MSPLPYGVGRVGRAIRVFRPESDIRRVAEWICDQSWKGHGVHVFRWPCGTVAVVAIGSFSDGVLLRKCMDQLLGSYARHATSRLGPTRADVLHDLNLARAA